jgi:hypothetical protein
MKEKPAILTDIVRLFGGDYITCEREIRRCESLYPKIDHSRTRLHGRQQAGL